MKKLILNFLILLSINFSFSQTVLVKKKIIEKYNIKNFEVLEPFGGGYEGNYEELINYLIKFPDGTFKVFDNSESILLSDHFINYLDCFTYKVSINTNSNGIKEWIIYENENFQFYSKPWDPIRIPYEKYDKILLGDESEVPDLIGIKGNDKTLFSVNFDVNNFEYRIFNVSKLNFYGDASFLETNKTYFPFSYGRIVPYKLEKSSQCQENCNHKSPFCNTGRIVYRYSDGDEIKGYASNDTINVYDELGEQIVNTNDSISSYAFNRIHPASGIKDLKIEFDSIIAKFDKNLIVRKEGFLHVFNIYHGYQLKKIDGFTDNFAYNKQGIFKFKDYIDPPSIFLPFHLPKEIIIKKNTINGDITYSFNELINNSLITILKLNFTTSTISIFNNSVEEEMGFDEYALKETEKRKDNPLQKWKTENPIYHSIYKDATYKEKYDVIKNSEFFTEQNLLTNYYDYSFGLPFLFNYFKLIPSFFDIDYLDIDLKLIEQDETNQGAVLFYDNFINIEGASASARLKALDEIITLFPTISELYYYRSYLNFISNNNEEALNDINKCIELDPTIRNYIRRIVHLSYSVSSFEKNKLNIYNDLNAAINLQKSSEGENYWVDYYLHWAKINFLLENKILSKNKTNEEVCIQVNSILDLLNNKLIDRKDLLQGELEKIENIKQKSKCK